MLTAKHFNNKIFGIGHITKHYVEEIDDRIIKLRWILFIAKWIHCTYLRSQSHTTQTQIRICYHATMALVPRCPPLLNLHLQQHTQAEDRRKELESFTMWMMSGGWDKEEEADCIISLVSPPDYCSSFVSMYYCEQKWCPGFDSQQLPTFSLSSIVAS